MSINKIYAEKGGRCIDVSHGSIEGKWYGFMPSDAAELARMEINHQPVDVRADFGYDIPLAGNIIRFPTKNGDTITLIEMTSGQVEAFNK